MKVLVAVTAMVVALASVAVAGPKQDKADALFKKAKALLGQQQYAEACAAFEQSHALDPATGTVLNLALCFEGWGKLAKAQRAYLEAEKLAAIKGDTKRSSAARQRADALTSRIPRLAFPGLPATVPPELEVWIDDLPIAVEALRIGVPTDPGPHVVVYSVAGAKKTLRVELAESQTKEVKLDLPAAAPPAGDGDGDVKPPDRGRPPVEPPRTSRGRKRRIIGLVTGGVGLVTVGISGVLGLSARSDYKAAFAAHCDAMNVCDDIGYDQTRSARSRANVASVIAGVGGAIIVTGVILYLTAPSGPAPAPRDEAALWIRPAISADGGGLVIGGAL